MAKNKARLEAINDLVFVKEDPVEHVYDTGSTKAVTDALRAGRIVLPDAYKDFSEKYPCRGVITSMGEMCKSELKIGDRIVFARFGIQRFEHEDQIYCVIRESDVLGIVHDA